jgi:hypothetical protein
MTLQQLFVVSSEKKALHGAEFDGAEKLIVEI